VPARACSIAVVDDDLAFAETLAVFSRLTGCAACVVEPRGVSYVVGRIVEMKSDVVFLDIALAHLDGCDVAEALRRRGTSARLIAVTGDWRPETAQRCRRAGFEAVWHKPIDPAQVEAFLDTITAG
jgi:CheY-like chemotaxis protein